MKKTIIYLVILTFFSSLSMNVYSQFTRGAEPAELYISMGWFQEENSYRYAVFYSDNNGRYIYPQYSSLVPPLSGEMRVGRVIGDSQPGTLYNFDLNNELWVSFDYGEEWELVHTSNGRYVSGSVDGHIYKYGTDPEGTLFHSENFGNDFDEVNSNVKYMYEVGVLPNRLYGLDGDVGFGFSLQYSNDNGNSFEEIPIPVDVAFYQVSGHLPELTRGAEPNELYLTSWWLNNNYKIFYSSDNGNTWIEQYESDYIYLYDWGVNFTAGREPGSFYVLRTTYSEYGDHILLYIDYSSDYGQTFTTYFHDLTPDFTRLEDSNGFDFQLKAQPNPTNAQTIINYTIPNQLDNPTLQIYNMHGEIVKQFDVSNRVNIKWNNQDEYGVTLPSGIYFYQIRDLNYHSQIKKLLIVN